MMFTGSNLRLLRCAVELAMSDIHNQIATCPDEHEYEGDLHCLQDAEIRYSKLLERIDTGLEKERRK